MTVPLSEDLRRRADAAGIEAGYWDALGSRRDLDDETATAVLRAMGVPLSGDATESAGVGGRALPPAWIVRTDGESADAGPIVEVPIAEGAASQALDWVLELESGPVIEGSSVSSPDVIGADDGRERLPIDFGIRPEHAHLVAPAALDAVLPGKIRLVERLGNGSDRLNYGDNW